LACQLANVPVGFSTGNGPPLVKASNWLTKEDDEAAVDDLPDGSAFSRFVRCLF
jgi:hypothetical protein